jgi:hypothetical protein
MCTEECRCYEGENGENKEKWLAYGDEILWTFDRNAGDQEEYKDPENGDLSITKPFTWTKDPEKGVKSF